MVCGAVAILNVKLGSVVVVMGDLWGEEMVHLGLCSVKSRPRASRQESASGPVGPSRGGEDPPCRVSAGSPRRSEPELELDLGLAPGWTGGPRWASAHLLGTSCFQWWLGKASRPEGSGPERTLGLLGETRGRTG